MPEDEEIDLLEQDLQSNSDVDINVSSTLSSETQVYNDTTDFAFDTCNVESSFVDSDSDEGNESLQSSDSSESDTSDSDTSDSDSDGQPSDDEQHLFEDVKKLNFSVQQLQSLSIVSFVLRHNLTGVAVNDLISLFHVISPEFSNSTKFEDLLGDVDHVDFKVCHYCPCCGSVFPEPPNVFQCETPKCKGYRYKGNLSAQSKRNRQPCCFFVIADLKSQLKYLLEQDGLLKTIFDYKLDAKSRKMRNSSTISDITNGKYYCELLEEGNFLSDKYAISGMFNTDGIPLYKSSKVKLWPIFLAINEIPLSQRFSRDNMVLAGIWQGKGNPPFLHFLNAFGNEMCELYFQGLPVTCGEDEGIVPVKVGIFLGVVDLQAKGYVLNMTMHNGEFGCSTCEEPGKSVVQGKGHARNYPYRERKKRKPFRQSDDIKFNIAPNATEKDRLKGICGITGLYAMPWFDTVLGIVPEYMHGVLMGVTKTLLSKWFSPSNCKKTFFIGKHIKSISKRLKAINPPDYIERLPRNLEKNYAHLKATELQSWLLYYALPCVNGYLPSMYLKHFACLSEGIHLLLGDCITEADLNRAEELLDTFYKDFSGLYGAGSCGLNVHNIGAHLVFYVRLWGPLYSWSCFGFEDWNAALLQSVHGTGDVTRQVICHVHSKLQLKKSFERMTPSAEWNFISKMVKPTRKWKVAIKVAACCSISGKVTKLLNGSDQENLILEVTKEDGLADLRKALRVQYGKERYYSKEYTRMKKRICYFALTKDGTIISINYFVYNQKCKSIFALACVYNVVSDPYICDNAGRHILRVSESNTTVLIPIEDVQEKLFFISVCQSQYIIRMCNMHGHGLLK